MNIDRLNININGVPSPGFSGDKLIFDELASLVGGAIPENYIDFILKANGGHPEVGCFGIEGDTNSSNLFDIDWFYSMDNSLFGNVKDALLKWGSLLGSKKLPIGRDGGGNQIYLDLNNDVPTVWLYLHDESQAKLKISNSFLAFLDGLIINPDLI